MGAARIPQHALPLQVAAVCYRRRGPSVEFLLVNTNGGNKWTFPKGDPESSLSHGQAAEREAWEEAGVHGTIESRHLCLYIHSKGVFWKSPGVREYVIKAFLLEVEAAERAARTLPESHLVQPRGNQKDPGQRPRSEVRPRIASGSRSRDGKDRRRANSESCSAAAGGRHYAFSSVMPTVRTVASRPVLTLSFRTDLSVRNLLRRQNIRFLARYIRASE